MNILYEQLFTEDVYLSPNNLNNELVTILHNKLQNKYEGFCRNEGYIIKDSIQVIDKKLGKIKTINNESKIIFNVKFKANIISPTINDTIECIIDNNNKMGLLCYLDLEKIGSISLDTSPLLIIIPHSSKNKKYKAGDKVTIQVNACRIKHKSTFIQVVGEIIE